MTKNNLTIYFIIITLIILLVFSFNACYREEFTIDFSAKLDFSSDTIMFDTVFTTIGSSTRDIKIYNNNSKHISISSVTLSRGSSSPFSINLDGRSGSSFSDVEIAPGDSMYLFAKVRIDPNDHNNPFVEEDEITFMTNGNRQTIKMLAWGQNANYIIAKDTIGRLIFNIIAHENETVHWTAERPYVIIGGYAAIDSLGTLIIDAGTKVYLHRGSGLWIYRYGNLQINGTYGNEVIFNSDRLEPEYDDISGMWDKIWINEGPIKNEIHHTIIRNGFIGIQAESLNKTEYWQENLILDNVRIENMSGMGIYAVLYSINAGNVLINNCGNYLLALTLGGEYDFRNCTFANYWRSSARDVPSVYIGNYFVNENSQPSTVEPNSYFLGNCIIYGNQNNELFLDSKGTGSFNCILQNCIAKIDNSYIGKFNKYMTDCIINKSPMFSDSLQFDFHLDTIISPAVNAGNIDIVKLSPISIVNDMDNVSRIEDSKPDIGAYEFKETIKW